MSSIAAVLLTFLAGPSAISADEPAAVASRIAGVTVYPGTAMVTRAAELPAGDGRYRLEGFPPAMDTASVRVRLVGGEVVGVETRERLVKVVAEPRVRELQQDLRRIEREIEVVQDERGVLKQLELQLVAMLALESQAGRSEIEKGRPNPEAWSQSLAFLQTKLSENSRAQRALAWKSDELQIAKQAAAQELGQLGGDRTQSMRELLLDVVGRSEKPMALEVDYLVGNAGWEPSYDLRARPDLKAVELVHRARVWQQSGEDWKDVEVALSTAQPQRGAQGPEPVPQWLALAAPRPPASAPARAAAEKAMEELGYASGDDRDAASFARTPLPFARIADQGLSLRYVLPRKETIESRDEPTTVLIGRQELAIDAERVCTPALDATVWLRARGKNTTDWVLLPGAAAVYFGSDYIGQAALGPVQRGEDLVLHLGPDAGVKVERTKVADQKKGAGFLSNKQSEVQAWRIQVENLGAVAPHPDGGVDVIVREVLPRSSDDRITVSLEEAVPKVSEDERWKKDREEKGFLTWVLRVPKAGKSDIAWRYRVSFPEGAVLAR